MWPPVLASQTLTVFDDHWATMRPSVAIKSPRVHHIDGANGFGGAAEPKSQRYTMPSNSVNSGVCLNKRSLVVSGRKRTKLNVELLSASAAPRCSNGWRSESVSHTVICCAKLENCATMRPSSDTPMHTSSPRPSNPKSRPANPKPSPSPSSTASVSSPPAGSSKRSPVLARTIDHGLAADGTGLRWQTTSLSSSSRVTWQPWPAHGTVHSGCTRWPVSASQRQMCSRPVSWFRTCTKTRRPSRDTCTRRTGSARPPSPNLCNKLPENASHTSTSVLVVHITTREPDGNTSRPPWFSRV
mmetsp:Transcript_68921/g.199582  ORF Transcript_68921/g.199582 Transcript_68921/m.199582 type:complete len:299 (+) Transcript_68921:156-1052(+)